MGECDINQFKLPDKPRYYKPYCTCYYGISHPMSWLYCPLCGKTFWRKIEVNLSEEDE